MNRQSTPLHQVHLASIGIEMAPEVVTSAAIEETLAPAWQTMGIAPGQLEHLTGVAERRWWPKKTSISEMSARACQHALDQANMTGDQIDRLSYTGVCRESYEPATGCAVAAKLELPMDVEIHDISNACLGSMDGIVLASDAIRLGRIDAALVVCCESAREIVEIAQQKLLHTPKMDHFISTLATLTGGSGAAAMLLVSSRISTAGPRLLGTAHGTDPRWYSLCRWGVEVDPEQDHPAARIEFMETDSIGVLQHGIELGTRTWRRFLEQMQWSPADVDRTICHQVGSAHRQKILPSLGLSEQNDFITYPFLGNMGTVSIPMTAAIAAERGILEAGNKVTFLGIGSGLVCRMIGWEWR